MPFLVYTLNVAVYQEVTVIIEDDRCDLIHLEWYRPGGTLKRSGYFDMGEPVGEWITYDNKGAKHKTTNRDKK